jgi:hypothetical protein
MAAVDALMPLFLPDGGAPPVLLALTGDRIAGTVVDEEGKPSVGRWRDRARRPGPAGPASVGPPGCDRGRAGRSLRPAAAESSCLPGQGRERTCRGRPG